MLYDNALLVPAYLHGWARTGDERYRTVAAQTVDYLVRELWIEGEGFASSQDADTDGVEGTTYTWAPGEGAPEDLLEPFEHGRSILRGELDEETRAAAARDPRAAAAARARRQGDHVVERPRPRRARRGRPHARAPGPAGDRDSAGRAPDRRRARALAPRREGRPCRASSTTTRTSHTASTSSTSRRATDAGCTSRAASRCSRSNGSRTTSAAASSCRRATPRRSSLGERISTTIRRRRGTRCSRSCCCGSGGSGATTSSNGPRPECSGCCCRCSPARRRRSAGRLPALDLHLSPPRELALLAEPGDEIARAALAGWDPHAVVAFGPDEEVPLLAGKTRVDGRPTLYECERFACRAPVTDADAILTNPSSTVSA